MKKIKLSEIAIDGGTQQRESINDAEVEIYAEAMRCGAQFPPVVLFFDGAQYWLADGFHRYHAYRIAPITEILADVRNGTCREARLFSAGANGAHGMRLTNADKRKAVMVLLDDKEWSEWSNRDIAKHCHVTHTFVNNIRAELNQPSATKVETVSTSSAGIEDGRKAEKQELQNQDALPKAAKPENTPTQFSKITEQDENHYDPAEDALSEAHDTIIQLDEENQRLKDAIAVGNLPEPEQSAGDIIAELRDEVKTLKAVLSSCESQRDAYMRECAELKNQCAMQRKTIKRLECK